MSAPASEIASIRRGYLAVATSSAAIDFAAGLIFVGLTGAWSFAPVSLGLGLLLQGGVVFLVARRLFAPIQRFLDGDAGFEETQRRITQLPLLTARAVGAMSLLLTLFRLTSSYLPAFALPRPTLADFLALCVILPVFYFTYSYFAVSDYLARICAFIFRRYGRNLELFFGSYRAKLIVALVVISIAPLAAVIVDLFSYDGDRLQTEITNDVAVAVMGVLIVAFFITRSLLRPVAILSRAMARVAGGDLAVRIPVTSNDEVGELTGQFNRMVEGLRERELIRETFGRYVDENVASAILRRQGEGVLGGETAEATILFTDIAGFTTIAEHLPPQALVGALNEYLETVLEPIRAHGGVVNTFIGDGLFASFNMPLACPDHASAAIRAAVAIQRAVTSRTFGDQGVALDTRIGICSGPVIGGSVGAGRRLSFTLLGDTVNLASRLEELNKKFGTRILVSKSTHDACAERFAFQPMGEVAVRGRSDMVAVYCVNASHQKGMT
jgi:class 3 adenylate cyclase